MEEAGNGKPFPAIAGKVHAVVLGKQIAQCFALDLKWGRGGGLCSVYAAFLAGKGQMTLLGALGKKFLNTYYFRTCAFASRHPEAPPPTPLHAHIMNVSVSRYHDFLQQLEHPHRHSINGVQWWWKEIMQLFIYIISWLYRREMKTAQQTEARMKSKISHLASICLQCVPQLSVNYRGVNSPSPLTLFPDFQTTPSGLRARTGRCQRHWFREASRRISKRRLNAPEHLNLKLTSQNSSI